MAAKAPKADVHVFMDRSFTLPVDNVRTRTLPAGWKGYVTKAEAKLIVAAEAGRIEPTAAAKAAEEEAERKAAEEEAARKAAEEEAAKKAGA